MDHPLFGLSLGVSLGVGICVWDVYLKRHKRSDTFPEDYPFHNTVRVVQQQDRILHFLCENFEDIAAKTEKGKKKMKRGG